MFKILKVPLQSFSRNELREELRSRINGKSFCHLATVNPEFLVEAEKNINFRKLLNKTQLNICDGMGIKILSKLLYKKNITRITGVEVAEIICCLAAKEEQSVFFLGGIDVAEHAAQIMKKKYPGLKIAGTLNGNIETFEEVKKAHPDIILVAFGSPKQEFWIEENAHKISSLRLGVGVGGTFDFWTGKAKRAPKWMQIIGLEWLYRLIKEPFKRGPRIARAVIIFPWLALKEKYKILKK